MTFWCVDDHVPEVTLQLLAAACAARRIEFNRVDAERFDFTQAAPLEPGSLLYRPAVSLAAMRVEQWLAAPGVSTFYADEEAIFLQALSPTLHFERGGLPVPRSFPCVSSDRASLRATVAALGGLPIVVKLAGGEGGVGVMRVDSLAALYSMVDYLLATGAAPMLTAYVADAVPWRVLVVGTRAVASYPMPLAEDDFRSSALRDAATVRAGAARELESVAVAAVQRLRAEMGGVDLLWHASGRVYLLEANFPCYFAPAQELGGIDVAGAMLEHLCEKAEPKAKAPYSLPRPRP